LLFADRNQLIIRQKGIEMTSASPVSSVSSVIAAVDVHYPGDGRAQAAAVLFADYCARVPDKIMTRLIAEPADYVPGAFYKRELPCLLAVLDQLNPMPIEIIIDGYVCLSAKPGLGQHLFNATDCRIPVIGVAKSAFAGTDAEKVFRRGSRRPLYITAAGMSAHAAADRIRRMQGPHRIPTLLRQVDQIARGKF
jgi:deoxyribonuclease V